MSVHEQIEVIRSLEKTVGEFIDKEMQSVDSCWQPSDFLPDFGQPDHYDQIRALQQEIANVPDSVLVSLIGNMITEEALPSYQTYFNLLHGINEDKNVASPSSWAKWSRVWTGEENRHGELLNKYLYLSGRVNMKLVEQTIHRLMYNGFDPQTEGDPYQGIVYTSFQERATRISHMNTGKLALRAGDSSLSKVCSTIAGEEAKHEKAYKHFMSEILNIDPNGGLLAFETMMRKRISMPAALMDKGSDDTKYLNYSSITQKIGVYTSHDYASIVEHLVRFWGIEKLVGLDEKGRMAQDYLCSLPSRYYKLAERSKEPTEIKMVWLNVLSDA
jgi:acyl-[acyl-carrier-protein] desaturase